MRVLFTLTSAIALSSVPILAASTAAFATAAATEQIQPGSQDSLIKPIVIDFEDFAEGTYIAGDEWLDKFGFEITYTSNKKLKGRRSESLPLRLYNSDCRTHNDPDKTLPVCTGGDFDLATGDKYGTNFQGNVLIIQEDNSKNKRKSRKQELGAPDDDARGGIITFTFKEAVNIFNVGVLDFDDSDRGEGFIRGFTSKDDTEAAVTFNMSDIDALVNPDFTGDNSLRHFDGFGLATFQRLEVEYPGSGAITELKFMEVAPGGSANWASAPESHSW